MKRVFTALLTASLLGPLGLESAHANMAFPESLQILLPEAHPHQIGLSTNFGLYLSDDDGATWTWTCERPQTAVSTHYAVGAPPLDRIFSLSASAGLAYSDDGTCTWHTAHGTLDDAVAADFFASATDPMRVLAVAAALPINGPTPDQIFASDDGGATFKGAIFTAPIDGKLTGVEIARSDPRTIYLAMYTSPGVHSKLVRSTDGGQSWTTVDVEASLGPNNFRIIAVDPLDAKVLTVRVIEPLRDTMAISRDGGDTFNEVLAIKDGTMTSYARLAGGGVFVGADAMSHGVGFRSSDGKTFVDWPGVPHLRALASRGDVLYVAAKNYTDGWAIGRSSDGGLTLQPLARYDQVKSIRACVQAVCLEDCKTQVPRKVWTEDVCVGNGGPPEAGDGGQSSDTRDAGIGATTAGCGCAAGTGAGGEPLPSVLVLLVLIARRGPRRGSGSS